MGKGGKAQTVGYKYYLGMHLGLCHGPIDAITRLRCDDRDAWAGYNSGGSINVNAPELFGGDKREGGVSGVIDVAMGGPAQGKNSYLVSKLGALIPAYRGVVGMIFRQCYLGNNPYLKQWSSRGQRIHVRQNGIPQWYDAAAAVYSANPGSEPAVLLAKNSAGWRYKLEPYNTSGSNYSAPDYDDSSWAVGNAPFFKGWPHPFGGVNAWGNVGGTNIVTNQDVWMRKTFACVPGSEVIVNAAFDNNLAVWINGSPVAMVGTGSGTATGSIVVNGSSAVICVYVDETQSTGGSNYTFADVQLTGIIPEGIADMNAAHIIRECLTDPEWGMGYTDDDIDEPSFINSANTFLNEGLGLSLLWDKTKKIEDFVSNVQEHVDCALYVSRTTGKFVLKPIRGGYDEGALLHLDESNIISVEDPTRVAFGELTNSVTVTYWDAQTGKDASITVSDTAMVQQQGVVINAPLQYPGFTNARNATIAAQRDLRALSTPLLSCSITADSDAKVLNIGDVFKFSWSRWGLVQVVMRVNGISYGTGRNNRVKITCTQDVFDTDVTIAVVVAPPGWTDPSAPPEACPDQMATEAPYWELVQALGQSDTDNKLLTHPEIGYVIAAGSRPASAINATLFTDNGDGYEDVGAMDFAPMGVLASNITKTQTAFVLNDGDDLNEVKLGSHFQIGDELMRVDTLDAVTGAITVGRGVLDTVPATHLAGDLALFWDYYAGFDPTEYVDGEEVDAKIVPVSGAGVLPIAEALAMPVILDQRAARPYAPGDLRINGDSYAPDETYFGEVAISWKHRNRLEQTGGMIIDHTAGNIGPEPTVVYRVQGYINDILVHTEDDIDGTDAVWTPDENGIVRVEVHAKRGELYSWQAPTHTFFNFVSRLSEDGSVRYTEEGDIRASED